MSHFPYRTPNNFLFVLFLFLTSYTWSQTDTIAFSESDYIIGEVKEMNRGVLTVKTSYSNSNFKIDWEKVQKFKSDQYYTITFSDRTIMRQVQLHTFGDGRIAVGGLGGGKIVDFDDIVYIRQLKADFMSKLSASIDIGYSLTKANNLQQFNTRSALGFRSDRWRLTGTYNQVRSMQDEAKLIKRTDATLGANRQFTSGFFLGAQVNFLSNTEQRIDLRTTGQLGVGYFIARTNNMFWNGFLGLAYNNENFAEIPDSEISSQDKTSYEGVVSTEVNLYDVGDFKLLTNITWFPSITEAGRNRIDLRFDVSYDLPLDFYVKSGISLNYDSQPSEGASPSDYVFQTGFGWEL